MQQQTCRVTMCMHVCACFSHFEGIYFLALNCTQSLLGTSAELHCMCMSQASRYTAEHSGVYMGELCAHPMSCRERITDKTMQ